MTKIDKTDLENIKVIIKESKIEGVAKIKIKKNDYEIEITSNNFNENNVSMLPLICYEIIFPKLSQKSPKETNLIINISEDGWFGNTIGPDQHFTKSIFRAVENNTFFLRSANKGVSAIIDNKGKIVKRMDRNEAGNIEYEVPLIKSNKVKNDLIFFILLITYLLIFLYNKKRNAK